MIRPMILAAALLACGCSQQQAGPDPVNESAKETQDPAASAEVPALTGEWQLTAIDGRPVDAASAMIATFRDGKVRVTSGCLARAWTYTQKRNMVAFSPDPGASSNCGGPPSAVQESAYATLDLVTMAIFEDGGSEASLSGNGGMLKLERR